MRHPSSPSKGVRRRMEDHPHLAIPMAKGVVLVRTAISTKHDSGLGGEGGWGMSQCGCVALFPPTFAFSWWFGKCRGSSNIKKAPNRSYQTPTDRRVYFLPIERSWMMFTQPQKRRTGVLPYPAAVVSSFSPCQSLVLRTPLYSPWLVVPRAM